MVRDGLRRRRRVCRTSARWRARRCDGRLSTLRRARARRRLAGAIGATVQKTCAKNGDGPRRQGTTATGRKDLGETFRHWRRHRHCALQPQAAENHRYVRPGPASSRHGPGRHRHRGEFWHHGVFESAVSRKSRPSLRHRACLQHLAALLLQHEPATAERRGTGRHAGAERSRQGARSLRQRIGLRRGRHLRTFSRTQSRSSRFLSFLRQG